ncbi:LysM peptidoglycan-binding domain-containing protein [Actinokineospora sp. HUAS TT18]|uniref:LysM peptidoglycan-binding domain-containing protein n=1 Tax=Actinokineospora sp. HUAS TT18 TaxID=3447451 RepID=UPI003F5271CB
MTMSVGIGASVATAAGGGAAVGAASAAVGGAVSTAMMAGARVPAVLVCVNPKTPGLVPFDFNPDKISIKRSASYTAKPNMQAMHDPGGASGTITKSVQAPMISISKIIFEGVTAKLRCDQLLRWMSPFSGIGNMGIAGASLETTLPEITFSWGPPMVAFLYQVRLVSVTINFVRFDFTGIPLRAEVDLSMRQQPSMLASLPTNPTSGGLPGRRAHTVSSGDSLQSIATTHYGRPGLWRRIAEVNGIQDPARLRPGQTVYLPNPEELV